MVKLSEDLSTWMNKYAATFDDAESILFEVTSSLLEEDIKVFPVEEDIVEVVEPELPVEEIIVEEIVPELPAEEPIAENLTTKPIA